MNVEKAAIVHEVEAIKLKIGDIKSTKNKSEKREIWGEIRGSLSVMLSLNLISVGLWQELSNLASESI